MVKFESAVCSIEFDLPGVFSLSSSESQLLRRFYRLVKNVCRLLLEFSASRFERQQSDDAWRLHCSLVRNDLLGCSLRFLAGEADWVVNAYDDLLDRPDLSYRSRRFSSFLDWLQKVKMFFARVSLLLTVCVRYLELPHELGQVVYVSDDDLLHSLLYYDFVDSYTRGVVRYPIGGPLPSPFNLNGF